MTVHFTGSTFSSFFPLSEGDVVWSGGGWGVGGNEGRSVFVCKRWTPDFRPSAR